MQRSIKLFISELTVAVRRNLEFSKILILKIKNDFVVHREDGEEDAIGVHID